MSTPLSQENPVGEQSQNEKFNQPSPSVSTPVSQENPVGEHEKFNQPSPSVLTLVSQENPVGEQSQNEKFNQPSPSVSALVSQENPVGKQSLNEKFHQSKDCMYASQKCQFGAPWMSMGSVSDLCASVHNPWVNFQRISLASHAQISLCRSEKALGQTTTDLDVWF